MDSITVAPQVGCPEGEGKEFAASLYAVLKEVPDPRKRRGRRYELAMVLACLLLAKLAGETSLLGIAEWVRLRSNWLGEVFACNRFPCANTYCNVCKQLDVQDLNRRLAAFFRARQRATPTATPTAMPSPAGLRHLACDGKELRGTYRYLQSGSAVLGVYDVALACTEAMCTIAGKGHEPAALQAWLREADLHNCLITADALHTQTEVCRLIRARQGHYLLIVKDNQPQLRADIEQLFSMPPDRQFPHGHSQSFDKGHGRREARALRSSSELNDLLAARWCDVAQVFALQRTVTARGVTTTTTLYGLTSLPPAQASAKHLLALVRQHWAIENQSHWRRDATLGEDRCKVRSPVAAAILAVLNSAVLALTHALAHSNLRALLRRFNASPHDALDLILGTS